MGFFGKKMTTHTITHKQAIEAIAKRLKKNFDVPVIIGGIKTKNLEETRQALSQVMDTNYSRKAIKQVKSMMESVIMLLHRGKK